MINFQTAPTVRNCTFEHNRAMKGGAVYNMVATSFPPRPGEKRKAPLFIGCTFRNNFAMGRGGGVSNDLGTAPVFLNCVFEENETPQKGGGMYNDFGCSPILINCLFRLNKAETAAAMGNDGQSSPILLRCTFTANQAQSAGPSLYQGTGPANNPVVLESVVWGNRCEWESAGFYNWHDNTPVVKDSVIEGGYPGAQGDDPRLNGNGVAAVNAGYRPGDARFAEGMLAALLDRLRPYQSSGLEDRPPEPGRRVQAPVPSSERIVYVDASRPAGGDGRSWAAAYSSLEAALADAGRDGAEVRVAAGVYRPAGNDRSASFRLYPGVRVYGGFTGVESSRNARDWRKNRTTLSGDMGVAERLEDNAYHVVTGADGALLDGFIITSGYADGVGYDGKGGGLINYRRAPQRRPNLPDITGYSPEIRNCVFTGNFARDGGAVYNYDRAKPRFIACVFTKNRADNGGAVLDRVGVEALYEQCEFLGNWARWRGGAAYFDYGSRPKINGSAFVENSTDGHGGAIYSASRASQLENTAVNLTGCRLEKNAARGDGGAAAFDDSTAASVAGSQFSANMSGRNGGAMAVTNRSVIENRNNRFQDNSACGEGGDVFQERNPGR
jgi:predicted outer membrane repeat protein